MLDALSGSLIGAMRAGTRELHEQLERQLDLERHCTLERYQVFLRATWAVVRPLEPALTERLAAVFGAPAPGTRVDRLRCDLASLSAAPPPENAPEVGDVQSQAEAFGAAYVIQGSLLGGAVITRMLRSRLGIGDDRTTYLHLYGDGLAHAWRQFVAAAELFGTEASADDRRVVIASAGRTFAAFAAAAEREGVPAG